MATSTGWPARPIGTFEPNSLMLSSVIEGGLICAYKFSIAQLKEDPQDAYINGVQMGPGATALHRMPFSPTIWLLSERMNATIAPLVAV